MEPFYQKYSAVTTGTVIHPYQLILISLIPETEIQLHQSPGAAALGSAFPGADRPQSGCLNLTENTPGAPDRDAQTFRQLRSVKHRALPHIRNSLNFQNGFHTESGLFGNRLYFGVKGYHAVLKLLLQAQAALEADDLTALDAALAQIETDGLETVLSEQGKALLAQLRAAQTAERAES